MYVIMVWVGFSGRVLKFRTRYPTPYSMGLPILKPIQPTYPNQTVFCGLGWLGLRVGSGQWVPMPTPIYNTVKLSYVFNV